MSLSVGELKKVSVQSIRDIAAGLRAKATSMRATKTGVTDLPHKGTWTGIAADNADHEIGTFGKGLGTDADAYENAAAKVDRAGDEFEGLKQLLTKLENEAAGKFSINEATGEVTPLSKDFNKADRDYIANTLKQLCAAGGQANDDLAAGIHATDTSGTTTPAYATGALPTSPNSAVKPDGVFGGVQNLATANPDGEPGATRAAAAAGADTQANYKEWYPKTPGSGDKLTIDPSKAGSFTGTVGALEKLPGAPKPADGFGSGVARQFGQGVNSRVDGLIDEAKNLTGQGGPGSPGVAESWAKFALGTADQMANPLGSLPGEVKEAVNDPAGFAGKKLFDVSSIAATGPLGGEAAAGARGLLGDLTGAETRHYVLFGTIVFATYAGIYFWFPKMTGRLLDERLGKFHFWLTFIGFHSTFLVQHWLGNQGMPRRYADYLPTDGFTFLNSFSTVGAFILGASTLPFLWNVFKSYRYGEVVTVDDPWGYGNSLEWATSCPPPRHNFSELPRIRSERPAFELHYPHMSERMRAEAHVGGGH
ncbi:Probable cytochrome c oxidase polypeptide I [Mycobacteroides abscessus]|nr:Probable cytochrome c oxidase polypeptide I [Mycobacteroides abscessus]CPX68865.1 Probable cytochrome c oxidase polypeptide I [Mycobacteroides abscessus]